MSTSRKSKCLFLATWMLAACENDGSEDLAPPPTCTDPEVIEKYGTERPDFPVVWHTEHLDIYAEEGQFVCAGMAKELERHVEFMGEQLGMEPRNHISFYYTRQSPELCGGYPGCTKADGIALGVAGTAYHELAHAVACQMRNGTAPAFREGLAVMFEPSALISSADWHLEEHGTDLYALLGDPEGGAIYGYGGHFSRWLLEREGGAVFAELYTASSRDPEQVVESLELLYGLTFDALESEYQSTSPHSWAPFRRCADIPHVDPDFDGVWRYSSMMDCDSENTMGPYERENSSKLNMYQSFTFTLEDTVDIEFDVGGTFDFSRIYLERCSGHGATEEESTLINRGGVVFEPPNNATQHGLLAGTWRVDVLGRYGPPGTVEVEFRVKEE